MTISTKVVASSTKRARGLSSILMWRRCPQRGLVVITSCGRVGILNTIRQAQEVSGIKQLHALIGGFHLGPARPDYTDQVVSELKAFEPDVVVPMHSSGQTFVDSVQKIMPDRLLLASAAARLNFGT
jgi:7,8-dihydropterin-6-yl-methyl-4-(beta-D-ribofuranosyl)aminobenzene 5'-phosphate synthase